MLSRATLLWLMVALATGFGLFALKYRVQGSEEVLARLNRQILQEEEAIHLLKAEWSYSNQTDRIESLARRYLQMVPLTGRQYGAIDDLPWRPASAPVASSPDAMGAPQPLVDAATFLPIPPAPPVPPRREISDIATLIRTLQ